MTKCTTANGVVIFNQLEHGIHGQPLLVPAHEYNRVIGLLSEARTYIARHTAPTTAEAAHGSIVDRIDAVIARRQASITSIEPQVERRTADSRH